MCHFDGMDNGLLIDINFTLLSLLAPEICQVVRTLTRF